jgi:hypothetical protein
MKRAIFKVLAVFVTVVAVAMMGASLAIFFVHPDERAEMNTPAMRNYTFEQTTGENPQWTVTRRFSTDPANPQDRGSVGTFKTAYDALIKAHADLKTYLTQQAGQMVADKTIVDEQRALFSAGQDQDKIAISNRAEQLKVISDKAIENLQIRSAEVQALSVKSRATREETAARRTDVLRLSNELEEARTDLFRLNAVRRDLTDRLVRLEIENRELADRQAQLASQDSPQDN